MPFLRILCIVLNFERFLMPKFSYKPPRTKTIEIHHSVWNKFRKPISFFQLFILISNVIKWNGEVENPIWKRHSWVRSFEMIFRFIDIERQWLLILWADFIQYIIIISLRMNGSLFSINLNRKSSFTGFTFKFWTKSRIEPALSITKIGFQIEFRFSSLIKR